MSARLAPQAILDQPGREGMPVRPDLSDQKDRLDQPVRGGLPGLLVRKAFPDQQVRRGQVRVVD